VRKSKAMNMGGEGMAFGGAGDTSNNIRINAERAAAGNRATGMGRPTAMGQSFFISAISAKNNFDHLSLMDTGNSDFRKIQTLLAFVNEDLM